MVGVMGGMEMGSEGGGKKQLALQTKENTRGSWRLVNYYDCAETAAQML